MHPIDDLERSNSSRSTSYRRAWLAVFFCGALVFAVVAGRCGLRALACMVDGASTVVDRVYNLTRDPDVREFSDVLLSDSIDTPVRPREGRPEVQDGAVYLRIGADDWSLPGSAPIRVGASGLARYTGAVLVFLVVDRDSSARALVVLQRVLERDGAGGATHRALWVDARGVYREVTFNETDQSIDPAYQVMAASFNPHQFDRRLFPRYVPSVPEFSAALLGLLAVWLACDRCRPCRGVVRRSA